MTSPGQSPRFAIQKTISQRTLSPAQDQLPEELHPVLRRIYLARGIYSNEQLDRQLKTLHVPDRMSNIAAAAGRVAAAVREGEHILIVGDFDADGATGSALAVRALRSMGAQFVDYCVPNRFDFGYGLSPALVDSLEQPLPDLLITVDNGISSLEGVEAAGAKGIQVIITDHHLPGPQLPRALAIVNPNIPGDLFPSKALAGVGVLFYLMLRTRSVLRDCGWFTGGLTEPNLAGLLDLVALGTVADLVPLDHNNRILVHQGLGRIRNGSGVPGIRALLHVAGRHHGRVTAADLGYAVGPRLNAAGRLEDMGLGIECLLSDDQEDALKLATRLDSLNQQRKTLQDEMQHEARASVRDKLESMQAKALPVGLCLFEENWHQGVVGLVASRLKDVVHRPVVAFAPEHEGGEWLKGSARSIKGVHIRDTLATIDAQHQGLIKTFGGHAMAAGLTLNRTCFDKFCSAFEQVLDDMIEPHQLQGVIETDGSLSAQDIGLDMAHRLRDAGPWGQQFPEPAFEGSFEILERRVVGQRHLKMTLQPGGGDAVDAIAFNTDERDVPKGATQLRIVYRLDVNEFRGRQSAQLIVEHII